MFKREQERKTSMNFGFNLFSSGLQHSPNLGGINPLAPSPLIHITVRILFLKQFIILVI
jgi:hypothetical protein